MPPLQDGGSLRKQLQEAVTSLKMEVIHCRERQTTLELERAQCAGDPESISRIDADLQSVRSEIGDTTQAVQALELELEQVESLIGSMKSPPLKSPQDSAKTRSSLTPISKLDGVLSSPVVAKRRVSSFGAPEMDFESWRSQGADELVLQQAIESMNEEMRTLAQVSATLGRSHEMQELADEREAVKRLDSPRLVPSVKKVASPTAPAVEWVPVAGSSLREQQLLLQVEEQTGQLRTQEKQARQTLSLCSSLQIRELERKVKALTSELANCNLNLYAC